MESGVRRAPSTEREWAAALPRDDASGRHGGRDAEAGELPFVSVLMAVRNEARTILVCLKSLSRRTTPPIASRSSSWTAARPTARASRST